MSWVERRFRLTLVDHRPSNPQRRRQLPRLARQERICPRCWWPGRRAVTGAAGRGTADGERAGTRHRPTRTTGRAVVVTYQSCDLDIGLGIHRRPETGLFFATLAGDLVLAGDRGRTHRCSESCSPASQPSVGFSLPQPRSARGQRPVAIPLLVGRHRGRLSGGAPAVCTEENVSKCRDKGTVTCFRMSIAEDRNLWFAPGLRRRSIQVTNRAIQSSSYRERTAGRAQPGLLRNL